MNTRLFTFVVALSLAGGLQCDANAQPQRGFVGFSAGVLARAAGADDAPYLFGSVGGSAPAFAVSLAWPMTSSVSVGPEVMFGGAVEGQQDIRVPGGNFFFDSAFSQIDVSGALRFAKVATERVRFETLAGVGLAFRSSERVGQIRALPSRVEPHEETLTSVGANATTGIEVPTRLGPRVYLVPSVRLQFRLDADRGESGARAYGIGRIAMFGGIGVRVAL